MTFRWLAKRASARCWPPLDLRAGADDPGRTSTWCTSSPPSRTRPASWSARCSKEDFEIYDNGARQEVAVFGRQTDQPLSVALLVDTSGSTAKDLGVRNRLRRRSSCSALLAEGNPQDRVALFSFNYDIQQGSFTRNYARPGTRS